MSSARENLGQLSWVAKRYRSPARLKRQFTVVRAMDLPRIRRRRRVPGSVWAVSVVRDELDVLPHTVRHMFGQGVDRVLVADNGSVDGTYEYLRDLEAQDDRVSVARDAQRAHWQSEKMTWLAHAAWRGGADWILPFDADEFWFAKGRSVADHLRSASAAIVHADFHHMVPVDEITPSFIDTRFVMDAAPSFPGKIAARSHPLLEIGPGNHFASRVGGEASGLYIAHAQYRNEAQVARKVRQGDAAARLTGEDVGWFSPHWAAGARLTDAQISDVWANLRSGRSDERLGFTFQQPVSRVQPLTWSTWELRAEI